MHKNSKKCTKFITIFSCLSILFNGFIMPTSYGANTYTQVIRSGIEQFPESYQNSLRQLKQLHPSWTFDAYYTGVSWDDLVSHEVVHGKNRVHINSDETWKCSCGNVASGYACASSGIVQYYLDPRNFLSEINVFQFSEMSYNENIHTLEGVQKSVKGTFLDSNVTFQKDGQTVTMSYAQIILDAARESKMSPYSIKAKIIQEVGSSGSASVSGNYPGYEGYYNFFNYGAYDNGSAVLNGMIYAKSAGWNTPYKSIVEGAKLVAGSYMLAGQNTAYFYKWDVVGTSILKPGVQQNVNESDMFSHQYMTNIQDPTSQSSQLYNMYANSGTLDLPLNFVIPVYNNMPSSVKKPSSIDPNGDVYYVDVESVLYIRTSPTTSASVVKTLTKDELVTMLEKNCAQADGYSWDKVKLANGQIGYAADQYLKKYQPANENVTGVTLDPTEVNLQVGNCAKVKQAALLASVIPSYASNQNVSWSSSNPSVASVDANGIVTALNSGETTITVTTQDGGKTATCKVIVEEVNKELVEAIVNTEVLRVRKEPTTNSEVIDYLAQDDKIYILQQDVAQDSENTWHKILLGNGRIGYIAKAYVNIIKKVQLDTATGNVKITPEVMANQIAQELGIPNYELRDASGTVIDVNSNIGTGYQLKDTNTNKTYRLVKLGDANGDAKISSSDYVIIKNYIMNGTPLNEIQILGADANNDGKVSSSDYVKIKNYIMEGKEITL